MEIARKVMPDWSAGSGSPAWCWGWIDYANEFTLLYNGTGFKLRPVNKSQPYGRYYTEDEQFLYIERRNPAGEAYGYAGSSVADTTHEYWIVRTRDGTEYRLGHNEDAAQDFSTNYYGTDATHYAGDRSGWVTFRWRVDQITDTRGNRIVYTYDDASDPRTCGSARERSSYLARVEYNFQGDDPQNRILFHRAARGSDGVDDDIYTTDCWLCRPFYQDDFLQTVEVQSYVDNSWQRVREYQLSYTETDGPEGHDNHTRLLASITEYDKTASEALPATAFGYTRRSNKGSASNEPGDWYHTAFGYERLTSIDNGYGATTTLSYGLPSSEDHAWNHEPRNYRVESKVVQAASGGYQRSYTYNETSSLRCYDNAGDGVCDGGISLGGNLIGYQYVTETLKTIGGTVLGMTYHQYKLNWGGDANRYMGREVRVIQKDAEGTPISKVETTWAVHAGWTSDGQKHYFAYPQWVKEYWAMEGVLPGTPQKQVENSYNTTYGRDIVKCCG